MAKRIKLENVLVNNYSSKEQLIGTYIKEDGKEVPLYKKIIRATISAGKGWKEIAHNISNLDEVIDVRGNYKYQGAWYTIPNSDVIWEIGAGTTYVVYYANLTDSIINESIKFIIKYTKTTD